MRPTAPLLVLTIGQGFAVGLMTAFAAFNLAGQGSPAILWASLGLAAVGGAGSFFHMHRLAAARYVLRRLTTSWLSREALSTGIFGVAAAGLLLWRLLDPASGAAFAAAAVAAALIGWAALWITARLYASIRAMLSWYTPWTVAAMIVTALAGGGVAALAVAPISGTVEIAARVGVAILMAILLVVKLVQWRIFRREHERLGQQATGFPFGDVRLYDTGTSKAPYRAQTQVWAGISAPVRTTLKIAVVTAEMVVPALLVIFFVPVRAVDIPAALVFLAGVCGDRWLFFADAVHSSRIFFPVDRGRVENG